MATNNEALPPTGNGFEEWQSIDERNGSDKSSNSGSQNSSSWYLVQVSFRPMQFSSVSDIYNRKEIKIQLSTCYKIIYVDAIVICKNTLFNYDLCAKLCIICEQKPTCQRLRTISFGALKPLGNYVPINNQCVF